jgi:hypothetical protein
LGQRALADLARALEEGDRGVGKRGADGVREMAFVHDGSNLLPSWLQINHCVAYYPPHDG